MRGLKIFTAAAVVLVAITVWLLPVPPGTRLFILVILAFSAAFVFIDSTNKGKTFAAITVALLALYLVLTLQRGILLVASGDIAGILLGAGLIVLPLIGAWALIREVLFGVRVQQLASILGREGGLPEDNLPRTASGGIDRESADAEFPVYQREVEADPENWRTWFRLSCAYDAAGDRKRARRSMRDAVALYQGRPAGALSQGEES
ncbi:tetratricopeptide repeat protein [Rothia uropygialis]|uniref:tetratricopeptide repeat protein n=1 Tax=Kocuria sp. 36 TaxID=1415402 RepID=UPI00101C81BB|nr:tetratricopeptide repeat protein [Kocuria sp. 36]